VEDLLDAINRGDSATVDRLVAKGDAFKWYSVGTERVGEEAHDRSSLVAHIESRYAKGETLRRVSFHFSGFSEGRKYAHFSLILLRRARDFPEARVFGKGALDCAGEYPQFAVWSLGPAAPPIPLARSTGYRDLCDGFKPAARRRICAPGHVPKTLWRPLALPAVAGGAACPVSSRHAAVPRMAPVLGEGPVYFAAGAYNADDRATMDARTSGPFAEGTGWGLAKTPLMMKKRLKQPLLVRGARIDASGVLGFSGGAGHRPFVAMQLAATRPSLSVGSFKGYGVNTWALTGGCYAIQVDGRTFSRVIVFRVAFP
jgi:hypothetical protein